MSAKAAAQAASVLRRECFVTIGATASFESLLDASLSDIVLATLKSLSYTHLTVQCGPSLSYFNDLVVRQTANGSSHGLTIKSFDFNVHGLGQEMRVCQAVPGASREGVVISHAGAGTILDAMRVGVPLIVVPNRELLDNHQAELAHELERQGYVTSGKVENLSKALKSSEKRTRARWEDNNEKVEDGIMGLMDEEMGYEARVREALD